MFQKPGQRHYYWIYPSKTLISGSARLNAKPAERSKSHSAIKRVPGQSGRWMRNQRSQTSCWLYLLLIEKVFALSIFLKWIAAVGGGVRCSACFPFGLLPHPLENPPLLIFSFKSKNIYWALLYGKCYSRYWGYCGPVIRQSPSFQGASLYSSKESEINNIKE